ncbi:15358_t:CDS:2 [Gigaspora margarita]|uniref:15358_t:CDS:1 n=1 Tax=Gigaspora margarita TaxID=4874 RepID=A0ABN7UPP6_GIGMA|nr:15358_t:CDS:2 [Gigaspora margarita]
MKLIDISDLDDLAAQVNEQTANDEDFLKKIFESGQSTHQSASYSGTSQSAIGKTPKNPEISLSNGQENFSQPSSIPLTLEQYKFRPRSYLTEGEAEHEEEIKQLRHRPLPTSQPTQPAIQFSTISEPTAQEKAISHKKKSDARRE